MEKVNRWIFYVLGMVVLAAGITLNTKTGLGVSPIISVAYCVSQIFELNFGDMTFVLYGIFVVVQLFLRERRERLTTLLQFPLSLVFSRLLNLCSACIPYQAAAHSLPENLAVLALAIVLTGVGVALTVNMRLVPNPGDGIVQAVAQRMGRDQGFAKNVFDLGCVAAPVCLGLLLTGRIVGLGLGTLLALVGSRPGKPLDQSGHVPAGRRSINGRTRNERKRIRGPADPRRGPALPGAGPGDGPGVWGAVWGSGPEVPELPRPG